MKIPRLSLWPEWGPLLRPRGCSLTPSSSEWAVFEDGAVKEVPTAAQPRELCSVSAITYMGRESEKEWKHVYAKLNHVTVHTELTQHCKTTILQ